MATTTPNYLWSVPTSSDLVKNGATAIETLGDSVDASLWNSGYGQAGKNKIINADCNINQRAFTSVTTNGSYGFDRFILGAVDGTTTYTAQTFTVGAAPVAGYESTNYNRVVSTGQTLSSANSHLRQNIEDVRVFAGQTVTFSFWAQAGSGTPKIAVELSQYFGSTGSPSASVNNYLGQVTLSTSWARYSVSVAIPSISGKTITSNNALVARLFFSAGSDLNSRTGSLGIQSNTFNTWGWQVEYGSYATPFQTASGGSPQSELAMCQRYYWRSTAGTIYASYGTGQNYSTTQALIHVINPVSMRTAATSIEYATLGVTNITATPQALTNLVIDYKTPLSNNLTATVASGLLAGNATILTANASATAYIAFSAEL